MSIFRKSYTKSLPAGAEIFQRNGQRHARWIDKAGHKKTARVTEGKDGSKRLLMKTATHTIRYRGTDGVIRDVSTGCRTRDGAHIVQSKLKQRVELVRAGVLSPADDKVSQMVCSGDNNCPA